MPPNAKSRPSPHPRLELAGQGRKLIEAHFAAESPDCSVILCGDFFQLPPVARGGERCTFLFESKCWRRLVDASVVLRSVFRQADTSFVELLNEMRTGSLSPFNVVKTAASRRRGQGGGGSRGSG